MSHCVASCLCGGRDTTGVVTVTCSRVSSVYYPQCRPLSPTITSGHTTRAVTFRSSQSCLLLTRSDYVTRRGLTLLSPCSISPSVCLTVSAVSSRLSRGHSPPFTGLTRSLPEFAFSDCLDTPVHSLPPADTPYTVTTPPRIWFVYLLAAEIMNFLNSDTTSQPLLSRLYILPSVEVLEMDEKNQIVFFLYLVCSVLPGSGGSGGRTRM